MFFLFKYRVGLFHLPPSPSIQRHPPTYTDIPEPYISVSLQAMPDPKIPGADEGTIPHRGEGTEGGDRGEEMNHLFILTSDVAHILSHKVQ